MKELLIPELRAIGVMIYSCLWRYYKEKIMFKTKQEKDEISYLQTRCKGGFADILPAQVDKL